MRWFERLLLGLSKLEIDVKFLAFEENSITSCPPLERFFMTISSIWCQLQKSTHATPVRFNVQSSVLGSSIDTPTPWPSTMLAPPFFILPQWNIPRHIVCRQAPYCFFFLEKGVGSIMTKWMKPQEHTKQTLTFLHTVFPTWEQTAKSSMCPTAPSMNYRIR